LTILRREQQRDSQNYKILVFFPAGRLVRFLFQFFTMGGRGRDSSSKRNTSQLLADGNGNDIIWEIHSRMSQSSRSRASNAFRNARRGILFSSDVSARGLDYPDVSLVVQMGAPSSEQDYIHRIGRTGRAGKLGRSLLVLLPFEIHHKQERWQKAQRRRLGQSSEDDYMKEDEQLASWLRAQNEEQNENGNGNGGKEEEEMRISSASLFQQCQDDLEPTRLKIRSYHVVLTPSAQAAYISFLAHYIATATTSSPNGNRKNSSNNSRSRSKAQNKLQPSRILAYADDFARGTGLASIPELDENFATKLGLN
jgi:superfamily II DNA/RNA helicase